VVEEEIKNTNTSKKYALYVEVNSPPTQEKTGKKPVLTGVPIRYSAVEKIMVGFYPVVIITEQFVSSTTNINASFAEKAA
jgi:hypothetical protein